MSVQKCMAIAFAIGGLIAALIATWYWWRSARINTPTPEQTFVAAGQKIPQEFMLMATQHGLIFSAKLSAKAAMWTGVAAVLGAASSVISVV